MAKAACNKIYAAHRFAGGTGRGDLRGKAEILILQRGAAGKYLPCRTGALAERRCWQTCEMAFARSIRRRRADLFTTPNVIVRTEFYYRTHTDFEHTKNRKTCAFPYNLAYFVLNAPREILYERIDRRVDQMLEEGLVKEVEELKREGCHRGMVSMQGLGYKEILAYLEGEYPLEEAVRILKRDTRHFAKRQLTWFRRESDVIWVDKEKFDWDEKEILKYMKHICEERKIV